MKLDTIIAWVSFALLMWADILVTAIFFGHFVLNLF